MGDAACTGSRRGWVGYFPSQELKVFSVAPDHLPGPRDPVPTCLNGPPGPPPECPPVVDRRPDAELRRLSRHCPPVLNRQITPSNCCRSRSGYGPYSPIGTYVAATASASGMNEGAQAQFRETFLVPIRNGIAGAGKEAVEAGRGWDHAAGPLLVVLSPAA
ncbi:hypothetical protein GCM10014713_30150 [Streptomyces purpureus]|uniref:Uncharacterized protein n=1 Tax=Streptomyces purpureus TaxID=1951 RepID=A0A918H301_9ACTN|nr:hypothetical protein GCM10014713_30150 [Streptomyces purpureus]